jgi:hypothetical protein
MVSISMFVATQITAGLPHKSRGIFIPSYVLAMIDMMTTYSNNWKKCLCADELKNCLLWQNSPMLSHSICFYEDFNIFDDEESETKEPPLLSSCHWSHWLDIFLHSYSLYIELLQRSIKHVCAFEQSSNKYKVIDCTDMDVAPLWNAPLFLHVYPISVNKEFSKNQWQNFMKLVQKPIPDLITSDCHDGRIPLSFQTCVAAYLNAKDMDYPSLFKHWSMEQCPIFRMRWTGPKHNHSSQSGSGDLGCKDTTESANDTNAIVASNDDAGRKATTEDANLAEKNNKSMVSNTTTESANDANAITASHDDVGSKATTEDTNVAEKNNESVVSKATTESANDAEARRLGSKPNTENADATKEADPIVTANESVDNKDTSEKANPAVPTTDSMGSMATTEDADTVVAANRENTFSTSIADRAKRPRMPPPSFKPDDFRSAKPASPSKKRRNTPAKKGEKKKKRKTNKKRKNPMTEKGEPPSKKSHTDKNLFDDSSTSDSDKEEPQSKKPPTAENLFDNSSTSDSDDSVIIIDIDKYNTTKSLFREADVVCKKDEAICEKIASAIKAILSDCNQIQGNKDENKSDVGEEKEKK